MGHTWRGGIVERRQGGCRSRCAIVAIRASAQVLGFSGATGAWSAHSAAGLTNLNPAVAGDTVGVVSVPASAQVLAYRDSTGLWLAHGAAGLTNSDPVAV